MKSQNNLIPQKFKNIKSILFSIIKDGSKSKHINEFMDICIDIAIVQYRRNKFKNEIINKECYNEKEIAYDLIADIFENRGGYYFQINKFFTEVNNNIDKVNEEEIIAKFVVLVRSHVRQRITDIRESYGEFYFKVKKAIEIFISRNKDGFNETVFRDQIYIYNSSEAEINFELPQITERIFLNELYNNDFKTYSIPEVIRKAFDFMNLQNDCCKAVEKTLLLNYISKFYKRRLKDNLSRNVEYLK